MSLPAWGGGNEEPLLKASKATVSHQRSCQSKDPGQGPETQSQSTSRHVWFSVSCSLEKPECLLHLMKESGRWQGPVQTATVGHLTVAESRFSVTKTGENSNPLEPPLPKLQYLWVFRGQGPRLLPNSPFPLERVVASPEAAACCGYLPALPASCCHLTLSLRVEPQPLPAPRNCGTHKRV